MIALLKVSSSPIQWEDLEWVSPISYLLMRWSSFSMGIRLILRRPWICYMLMKMPQVNWFIQRRAHLKLGGRLLMRWRSCSMSGLTFKTKVCTLSIWALSFLPKTGMTSWYWLFLFFCLYFTDFLLWLEVLTIRPISWLITIWLFRNWCYFPGWIEFKRRDFYNFQFTSRLSFSFPSLSSVEAFRFHSPLIYPSWTRENGLKQLDHSTSGEASLDASALARPDPSHPASSLWRCE